MGWRAPLCEILNMPLVGIVVKLLKVNYGWAESKGLWSGINVQLVIFNNTDELNAAVM